MSNRIFVPLNVRRTSKGMAINYEVYDPDDGLLYRGGSITLDLKWLKPCTMKSRQLNKKWQYMVDNDTNEWHFMIFKNESTMIAVDEKLIKMVRDFIFEREILSGKTKKKNI